MWGGYLLQNIKCKHKYGIEINESARKIAGEQSGISVYSSAAEIPENSIDVIISNHALEHTFFPLEEIKKLKSLLKENGKIIFVTPFENSFSYNSKDRNMHLYTWTPQNLANLFKTAGYTVLSVEVLRHMWPKDYVTIAHRFGEKIFHKICRLNSIYHKTGYQVRIVCCKGDFE